MKSDVVASTFLDLIFLTIHLSLRLRQERNVLLFFFLFFSSRVPSKARQQSTEGEGLQRTGKVIFTCLMIACTTRAYWYSRIRKIEPPSQILLHSLRHCVATASACSTQVTIALVTGSITMYASAHFRPRILMTCVSKWVPPYVRASGSLSKLT